MAAITVGVVPVSVREALGRDDSTKSIIWEGTAQNVSPAVTVYRLRSVDGARSPGDGRVSPSLRRAVDYDGLV